MAPHGSSMIAVALLLSSTSALVMQPGRFVAARRPLATMVATTGTKALAAERYVATNRFRMPPPLTASALSSCDLWVVAQCLILYPRMHPR